MDGSIFFKCLRQSYCNRCNYWWISNVVVVALFICSGGNQGGNFLKWMSLFFLMLFFVFCGKTTRWGSTDTSGQKGQTWGPVLTREVGVREEEKEAVRCFFNDLWRLNMDKGRGTTSKEYLERLLSGSSSSWVNFLDLYLRHKLLRLEICRFVCFTTVNIRVITCETRDQITHPKLWRWSP